MTESTTSIPQPPPSHTAPPRRRRRAVVLLLALGFLAAPPAFLGFLSWSAQRDYEAALAETEQLDPGWRLDELLAGRPKLPDERNAAVQALKALERRKQTFLPKSEKLFNDLPPAAQLNFKQHEALRDFFDVNKEARAAARRLKDLPEGCYQLEFDPEWSNHPYLVRLQHMRELAHFLHLDVLLRAHEEDPETLDACRAILHTVRPLEHEPSLVCHLVRVACLSIAEASIERALAQTQPSEEALRAMQDDLAREVRTLSTVLALRGERTGGVQLLQAIHEGRVKRSALKGITTPRAAQALRDWLFEFLPMGGALDRAGYLRAMNRLIEAAQLPIEQQPLELERLSAELHAQDPLLSGTLPACQKVVQAQGRVQAQLRAALVAVAAERYRLKHDAWPVGPEELVRAGYLSEAPADPYDGRPLRWRRVNDGVLIYAVGTDQTDNGGNLDPTLAYSPGGDIGFRLFDVAARRQPALPPRQQE